MDKIHNIIQNVLYEPWQNILSNSFIEEIYKGNIIAVKSILDNRIEQKTWFDTIRYNLYKNIDIHDSDEYAFYTACKFNRYDIVKYLIETGEKLNSKINIHVRYDYAITHFCYDGNMEMVKYLIEYCFRINDDCSDDFYNETLLYEACNSSNLDVLKYIVEHCEKVNIRIRINDNIILTESIMPLSSKLNEHYTNDIIDYIFYLVKHNYYKSNRQFITHHSRANRYIVKKNITRKCKIEKYKQVKYIFNNTMYVDTMIQSNNYTFIYC